MSTKSPLRSVPLSSLRSHHFPDSLQHSIPPSTSRRICLRMTSRVSRNVSIFSITIRVEMSPLRNWQPPSRLWAFKNKQERSCTSCRLSHLIPKWISKPFSKSSASMETASQSRAFSSCSKSSTKTIKVPLVFRSSLKFVRALENVSLLLRSSK